MLADLAQCLDGDILAVSKLRVLKLVYESGVRHRTAIELLPTNAVQCELYRVAEMEPCPSPRRYSLIWLHHRSAPSRRCNTATTFLVPHDYLDRN
jgi:hypothetical protein